MFLPFFCGANISTAAVGSSDDLSVNDVCIQHQLGGRSRSPRLRICGFLCKIIQLFNWVDYRTTGYTEVLFTAI